MDAGDGRGRWSWSMFAVRGRGRGSSNGRVFGIFMKRATGAHFVKSPKTFRTRKDVYFIFSR